MNKKVAFFLISKRLARSCISLRGEKVFEIRAVGQGRWLQDRPLRLGPFGAEAARLAVADSVRIFGNRYLARRAPADALIPNIICAFNRCRAGSVLCGDACIGPFLLFFYRR
jgi:hypothetical protein